MKSRNEILVVPFLFYTTLQNIHQYNQVMIRQFPFLLKEMFSHKETCVKCISNYLLASESYPTHLQYFAVFLNVN